MGDQTEIRLAPANTSCVIVYGVANDDEKEDALKQDGADDVVSSANVNTPDVAMCSRTRIFQSIAVYVTILGHVSANGDMPMFV
jgi:hypothetical protein